MLTSALDGDACDDACIESESLKLALMLCCCTAAVLSLLQVLTSALDGDACDDACNVRIAAMCHCHWGTYANFVTDAGQRF